MAFKSSQLLEEVCFVDLCLVDDVFMTCLVNHRITHQYGLYTKMQEYMVMLRDVTIVALKEQKKRSLICISCIMCFFPFNGCICDKMLKDFGRSILEQDAHA